MSELKADKEGSLSYFGKEKWKDKHAVLSGGSLLLSKKKGDAEFDKALELKGSTVKEGNPPVSDEKSEKKEKKDKKNGFSLVSDGITYYFQAESEKEAKGWIDALKANAGKEAAKVNLAKKKQSAMMSMKKNISGKAATSGAGKSLIKEELGKSGVRCIEIMKEIITLHEGKKKATEVEDNVIRFAVKILLLHKNKDISTQELMKTLPYLRAVWSNLIDFCEMSFAYEPATLAKNAQELSECFVKLIGQHVTDKTLDMIKETIGYCTQEKLLDRLFKDPAGDPYKKELEAIVRKAWIKLFKDAKK